MLLLAALLGILTFTSLAWGRYPLKMAEVRAFFTQTLFGQPLLEQERYRVVKSVLIDIRLPRVIAAILIGAALSVSGAALQSMFINPLVSPGLLGVLAGASFGAALGMLFSTSWLVVQAGAFSFGLIAVLVAVALSAVHRGNRVMMLILGGIVSGALFTALLSVVKYLADPYERLPAIVYWLMGGLSAVDNPTVITAGIPMIAGIIVTLSLGNHLNILSMGDEEARSLGVNVTLLRLLFIVLATILSALSVVLGGIIGWVGLLIPHVARMLVGPDNRILLPAAALIGASYLLIADDIARMALRVEIPIGILTSLVGVPFFAFVLCKTRKGWS